MNHHLSGPDADERGDALAALIGAAGRPAPIDAARAARVRAAVRARWHVATAWPRRRRRLLRPLVAAAILAVAVATAFGVLPIRAPLGPELASVEAVQGGRRAAQWIPGVREPRLLAPGMRVGGGHVMTSDDGRLALRLDDGRALRLDAGTSIVLRGGGIIDLRSGAVYIDSAPGSGLPPVRVRTAYGEASDQGTQFEVRVDDGGLRVRVREGRVDVRRGTRLDSAAAGEELRAGARDDAALPMARAAIAVGDAGWDWARGLAVAPDLDGATLGALLAWAERELGGEVRFADPREREAARRIRLHGALAGLSPLEALQAALPAAGLALHVDAGVLSVRRSPGVVPVPGSIPGLMPVEESP